MHKYCIIVLFVTTYFTVKLTYVICFVEFSKFWHILVHLQFCIMYDNFLPLSVVKSQKSFSFWGFAYKANKTHSVYSVHTGCW
jgi:hypothetical protein